MRHRTLVVSTVLLGLLAIAGLSWASSTTSTANGPDAQLVLHLPIVQGGAGVGGGGPTAVPTIPPSGSEAVQIVTQIGGMATDLVVENGYAYVTQGSGLTVYDVRDPAIPELVGRVAPLGGAPEGVALFGHHAYVATSAGSGDKVRHAGLAVVDVGDPARPALVERLEYDGGLADVVIAAGHAFVSPRWHARESWLRVLDLAVPTRPRQVGQMQLWGGSRRLAIVGTRLYSAGNVVDISDPTKPRHIEEFAERNFEVPPSDLAPFGDFVAFTASDPQWPNHLAYVRRVSLPLETAPISRVDCPSAHDALGITAIGEHVLTVGRDGGCAFDLPADGIARSVHAFDAPGQGTAITVAGDTGYVATNFDWRMEMGQYLPNRGALQTLDLADPSAPRVRATYAGPSAFTADAAGEGDRLYVVDGGSDLSTAHLWVLDTGNVGAPRTLSMVSLEGIPSTGLIADGHLLWMATVSSLQAWDVSVPTALRRIGVLESFWGGSDRPLRFFKRGNFIYTISGGHDFSVVDVHDPTQLTRVPTTVGGIYDVVAGPGDVGYWLTDGGIQAVRLGLGMPVPLGPVLPIGYARLAVSGSTVYALEIAASRDQPRSLHIVDATNSAALREVGTFGADLSESDYEDLVTAGERLFVASPNKLTAWDIRRPLEPRVIGEIEMPGYALVDYERAGPINVSAWGSRAIVAQLGGGVTVVEAALH
jgi:hypothetical protein